MQIVLSLINSLTVACKLRNMYVAPVYVLLEHVVTISDSSKINYQTFEC